MANETYSEKLKNPAWQKKRLEVLNRDNFTCVLCSDTETELHIHHKEYKAGKNPWEYENDNFQTLCKHCHLVIEFFKECKLTPVITGKSFNEDCNYFLISTIFNHLEYGLILSMDKYYVKEQELRHTIMIEKSPFKGIDELFQHAEKLLPNGNL